jgi:hypothetical protein
MGKREGREMDVINLDGLTLVGQGSEWFWAMLQMILLTVTLIVIVRQLGAQAAANAQARIASLFGEWSTFEMQYRRLVLALHLRYEGIQGKAWPGSVTWEKAQPIAIYMSNLAYLLRKGHVTIEEMAGFNIPVRQWVAALGPFYLIAGAHAVTDFAELEWLAARFADWDRQTGRPRQLLSTADWLDDVIERTTQNLRLEQERKAGVIPERPSTAPLAVG